MEPTQALFNAVALIMVLGIGGQWLAWKLRVPAILVLLVLGCVAGAGTGWLQPEAHLGTSLLPLVSLAVAMILFEGGLTLRLDDLKLVWRSVMGLLTVGVVVTWILVAGLAYTVLGLPWSASLVLGAVLTVTGPTVIGPLLREIRPSGQVGAVAKWEGIVVDPIGATLAVLIFEASESLRLNEYGSALQSALGGFGRTALVGGALGVLSGAGCAEVLRRFWVPDYLRNPVTLMSVVLSYVAAETLQHEAGLVAVTVMGVWLANQRGLDIHSILEFKETLTVLLISVLFIVLSARIELVELAALGWQGPVFALAVIALVRPTAVGLATLGSNLTRAERLFLAGFAPRGIVAAAVASVFALRMGEEGAGIAPATFLVIIMTVAFYGLTSGRWARHLGLATANPQGVLIAGANRVARAIGSALHREGVAVLLVDTRYDYVAQARDAGLRVHFANILSNYVLEELDLGGIGRFLALTPNNQVNTLAAHRFRETLGSSHVYQLRRKPERERLASDANARLAGRELFAGDWDFQRLDQTLAAGGAIKATKLTAEFTLAMFKEKNPDAVVLFVVQSGVVGVQTGDRGSTPPQIGQTILYLSPVVALLPDTQPAATRSDSAAASASTPAERPSEPRN